MCGYDSLRGILRLSGKLQENELLRYNIPIIAERLTQGNSPVNHGQAFLMQAKDIIE